MSAKQLSDNNPDGTVLGQSSADLIGFYGATPVARYSTSIAVIASTAAVSIGSTTQWGYSTSTQANAILTAVRNIATALDAYGLSTSG